MQRRYALSLPALIIALLLVIVAAARCGRDAKQQQSSKKPGTTTGGVTPADWDGAQDWAGSEWEVIEE
jgi:hypothetical protein